MRGSTLSVALGEEHLRSLSQSETFERGNDEVDFQGVHPVSECHLWTHSRCDRSSLDSYRRINKLESLILEGCELIDDHLFVHLVSSFISKREEQWPREATTIEGTSGECRLEDLSCPSRSSKEYVSHQPMQFSLKILNLSGCYRLTDGGLK